MPAATPPAPRPEFAREPDGIDWPLIVGLRRVASAEIAARLAAHLASTGRPLPEFDRRLLGRSVVRSVVRAHARQQSDAGLALWSLATEQVYAQALESAIFGYGRLQPLFEIPAAENIEINGHESVMVQFPDGTRTPHPPVADSDEELIEAIRFLGESATPSRPFDEAHPTMTLALGDRFRLHAIAFGLTHRPAITIRQHTLTDVSLPDLADTGMLPRELARLLTAAVRARKSVVIAGDQGAGKTTLLRALIAAIPHGERFGTLETDYELLTHLQPGRSNIVALQARIGMGELVDGRHLGEYSVADLIPEALRQNLTRLVVGEVRGTEAGAMFQAMQAGAGTLSTTHSHSAESTIDRLAARVAEGGVLTMSEAYRQIAHHLDLLIHVQLTDDTWRGGRRRRVVSEVRGLTGAVERERPVTHLVYRASGGTPGVLDPGDRLRRDLAEFLPHDSPRGDRHA
nr:CpaF/VirB11 family protein [Propionicicella superfundia]